MMTPPASLPDLRTALREQILVLDGAMGTSLHRRGMGFQGSFESANLENPDWVSEVHRGFLEAGADAILTNTFGANRFRLSRHGLESRQQEMLEAGGRLARESAADRHWVLGSIGPLGVPIEPIGRLGLEEARAAFSEVAAPLLDSVDGFCLETFTSVRELEQAVLGVRETSDLPILAFLTVGDDLLVEDQGKAGEVARRVADLGVDLVGFNCSSGPRVVLEAVRQAFQEVDLPLGAKPNAGMPRQVQGRVFYEEDPDYFARFTRRLLQVGGRVIGGCCGTTQDHIQAIAKAAKAGRRQLQVLGQHPHQLTPKPKREGTDQTPVPLAQRSALGGLLARGQTAISVELVPPRTTDATAMIEAAHRLHQAGVHAVNLPDGPRASARLSNLAAAALLMRETRMEPLLHFCCRDRNLLGMQSDLLGAAALGIHNLLVITGDPPYQGDYPDLTAVFDVDAIGLCNIVGGLNRGLDLGGNPMPDTTAFCFGAAFNPGAVDLETELDRLRWKVKTGVDYLMTQPIFDAATLVDLLPSLPTDIPPILAGIWPLRSLRNAEFLHSEVPGIRLPAGVLSRMEQAEDRGDAAAEGLRIAKECIEALRGHVAGFQLAAPFNRVEAPLELTAFIHEGA